MTVGGVSGRAMNVGDKVGDRGWCEGVKSVRSDSSKQRCKGQCG